MGVPVARSRARRRTLYAPADAPWYRARVLFRLRASAAWALALAAALPTLGCSSLTRPDDITITAEPIAQAAAPAAPARPEVPQKVAPGGARPAPMASQGGG